MVMKIRISITFILILAIILSILHCKKDNTILDNNPKVDPAILGLWSHHYQFNSFLFKSFLRFKDTGKFDAVTSEDSLNLIVDYGSYSTNGNEITIIDGDNPQNVLCKNIKGTYKYYLQGNNLTFELLSDTCYGRSIAIQGLWIKE
jgi:hypothetical protein